MKRETSESKNDLPKLSAPAHRALAAAGGHPGDETDHRVGARLHGDAHLRLSAAPGVAGERGAIHPEHAGRGRVHDRGVALRVAHGRCHYWE